MAARKTQTRELDAADRNALPDSAFAFPRVRKEPLTDARHVRNAIARFDQVRDVKGVPGRSTMTKAELVRALERR
jgi:hypothetical protein